MSAITRRSNPLIIKQIFMFKSLPLSSHVQNRSGAQRVFLRTGGKIYLTKPQIPTARRHKSGHFRHQKKFEDLCKIRNENGREFISLPLSGQIPWMFDNRKKRKLINRSSYSLMQSRLFSSKVCHEEKPWESIACLKEVIIFRPLWYLTNKFILLEFWSFNCLPVHLRKITKF